MISGLYKVGYNKLTDARRPHAVVYKSSSLFGINQGMTVLHGADRFQTIAFITKILSKLTKRGKPYQILSLLDNNKEVYTYYDFDMLDVKVLKPYIFIVGVESNEYDQKDFRLYSPEEVLEWKNK